MFFFFFNGFFKSILISDQFGKSGNQNGKAKTQFDKHETEFYKIENRFRIHILTKVNFYLNFVKLSYFFPN